MTLRRIEKVFPSQKVNMGGHILDQPLPTKGLDSVDPFLLIHHWKHTFKGGQKQKEIGVGPHPHRGFSPVTFVYKGSLQHRDSLGNDATVSEGGTQWMHAGKGITHSERPGAELAEKGGLSEFIQFWVNTPATFKMEKPYYLPLQESDTPYINGPDYEVRVVAGEFEGIVGPARTYSPMTLLRTSMTKGAEWTFELPENFNTVIYQLDGQLNICGAVTKAKDLTLLKNEGGLISIQALKDTRLIVLSGVAIGEKVASYGPFVMNTQTQILEALKDAQMGKMGVLIEEF